MMGRPERTISFQHQRVLGGEAYDLVETLGSTKTRRASANNEDVDVAERDKLVNCSIDDHLLCRQRTVDFVPMATTMGLNTHMSAHMVSHFWNR